MTPCRSKPRATWFQTPSPMAVRPSGSSGSARVWSPATSVVVIPSTPGPISEPPISIAAGTIVTTADLSSIRVRRTRSGRRAVFRRGAVPCRADNSNSLGSGGGVAQGPTRLIPARPGRVVRTNNSIERNLSGSGAWKGGYCHAPLFVRSSGAGRGGGRSLRGLDPLDCPRLPRQHLLHRSPAPAAPRHRDARPRPSGRATWGGSPAWSASSPTPRWSNCGGGAASGVA